MANGKHSPGPLLSGACELQMFAGENTGFSGVIAVHTDLSNPASRKAWQTVLAEGSPVSMMLLISKNENDAIWDGVCWFGLGSGALTVLSESQLVIPVGVTIIRVCCAYALDIMNKDEEIMENIKENQVTIGMWASKANFFLLFSMVSLPRLISLLLV
ncbi:hypothetical protein GOBAR_AA23859 [Gossypium barbadense]|uniref:Uncharacterized protein n=1 Tax=Gossypium barbadense TaxID=3634 RepID=A0A2P5X0F0_GOSBA|nr:hypothetical protein GOBAR_AA23859 [Gossypium barbadense]